MSCSITLPIWPSSLDCISWSKDNYIAVGGGDSIAILVPLLHNPGPNGVSWDTVVFRANAFTAEEIPLKDPLSFENSSIGEELSLRHVHALQWSSPGLSKFGRCALAVLSSNHVLSIWEHDGKPGISENWKRKAIVNHAVRRHYQRLNSSLDADNVDELLQVHQRVRAFIWSPPVRSQFSNADEDIIPHVGSGHHLLVVSTEAGDILFLHVQSPHDILHPECENWLFDVVHSFNVCEIILQSPVHDVTNGANGHHSRFSDRSVADSLALGSWTQDGESSHSRADMAFIARGQISCVEVESDCSGAQPILDAKRKTGRTDLLPSRSDLTGPLSFVPKTRSLIAFGANSIFCVDLSKDNGEAVTSHHLDDRWDEISGTAFTTCMAAVPTVHIVSHLSTASAETTALTIPLDDNEDSPIFSWQEAIQESESTFSLQHGLAGNVLTRVWGIAASPLGDYAVTAITLHPSDSGAYLIPSECYTVLNITYENRLQHIFASSDGKSFGSEITTEALLFSLQRHVGLENGPVDPKLLLAALPNMGKPIIEGGQYENHLDSEGDETNVEQLIMRLREKVFTNAELVEERLNFVASMADKNPPERNLVTKLVVENLVGEVVKLPAHLREGGKLSTKLYQIYQLIESKLDPTVQDKHLSEDTAVWDERCQICRKRISFESIKWARCEGGHTYSRCGLTFFAIQSPGLTKSCTVCGSDQLSEWLLPEFTTSNENGETPEDAMAIEPPTSLARVLFAAFNTCIYCGGKF